MPRRPLLAGGLVAISVGALLLSLGLGRGEEGTPAASAPSSVVSATPTDTAPQPSPSLVSPSASSSATPSTSVAPAQPMPEPTRAVRKALQGASPQVSRTPATSGLTLGVSAIGLRVPVRSGGVSSSGKINPPADTAMWVRGYGRVRPGQVGTAVIAGHVASSGDADVFARLSAVRVGAKVTITSGSTTRTYVVRRAAVVNKAALTHDADVWGQNTSRRRVVLVTCDDELGYRSDGHRVANYVVVADAV